MNQEILNHEPKALWHFFEQINEIPRASKKEEKIIAFMKAFGENLGLKTYVDACGNVIIFKPGTAGKENKTTVILQSHLDMVHQKNADTQFDFDTQGIESIIDSDWLKAKGTTLGADNGIGVASIMTLLASTDIPHPPLEALFTIDEETGMTGAFNLEKGILNGKFLLNLDTEDDDEFSIGCAGGIDTNTSFDYTEENVSENKIAYEIKVSGLKGGHSGVDIHLERGNANKIMNRLLAEGLEMNIQLVKINGGSLRNAIPRESTANVIVSNENFEKNVKEIANKIKAELSIQDENLQISISKIGNIEKAMSEQDSQKVILAIRAVFNGVFTKSVAIADLVETSSSFARVILENGKFITQSLQRSSVDSAKIEVAKTVGAAFKIIGCDVKHEGEYPGWKPNPNSPILDLMKSKYEELFQSKPKVFAIHAGLECGILGERVPGLDMISFGPTIKNPHSPDEKVSILSVQKFWKFLLAILDSI
ncbi:MAG: aminoacyl-histidine dipeptidase [Chitinophagaceae bacterium]|nr:aminoacyl-histidine dipeptidase [Chitinophagaceae bacterium]